MRGTHARTQRQNAQSNAGKQAAPTPAAPPALGSDGLSSTRPPFALRLDSGKEQRISVSQAWSAVPSKPNRPCTAHDSAAPRFHPRISRDQAGQKGVGTHLRATGLRLSPRHAPKHARRQSRKFTCNPPPQSRNSVSVVRKKLRNTQCILKTYTHAQLRTAHCHHTRRRPLRSHTTHARTHNTTDNSSCTHNNCRVAHI